LIFFGNGRFLHIAFFSSYLSGAAVFFREAAAIGHAEMTSALLRFV
jgi:hypothetical protein